MGLDQYAYAVHPSVAHLAMITERELTDEEMSSLDEGRYELQYWRKHADLNKWMEDLYVRKGGTESFNCIPLPLERDDIIALREHIDEHGGYAQRGEGFFWGNSQPEDIVDDRKFIDAALNALDEGSEIYYYCWW